MDKEQSYFVKTCFNLGYFYVQKEPSILQEYKE